MSACSLRPLLRTTPSYHALRRPTTKTTNLPTSTCTPIRNANLLKRPKHPWLMDQLVILSDGSAYKQLTTSPKGIIRTTKDVRNHPMWNPSSQKLMSVEEDEAGKLSAFRERYGRAFDSRDTTAVSAEEAASVSKGLPNESAGADNIMDLITGASLVQAKSKGKGKKK